MLDKITLKVQERPVQLQQEHQDQDLEAMVKEAMDQEVTQL